MTDDMKDNDNTEAGLRAQLEKVTAERDLYDKKLQALVLVLADVEAQNARMKKEIAVTMEGLTLFTRCMRKYSALQSAISVLLSEDSDSRSEDSDSQSEDSDSQSEDSEPQSEAEKELDAWTAKQADVDLRILVATGMLTLPKQDAA